MPLQGEWLRFESAPTLHEVKLPLRLRCPRLVGQHGLKPLQRRGVLGDIGHTKGCFEVGGDRRRPPVDVRIQQRFSVDRWLGVLANHGADPRLDIAAQFVRRGELADQPLVLLGRDGVRFWSADDDALEPEAFDGAEDGHCAFGAEPFPVGPRIPVQKDWRLESKDFRLEPEVIAVSSGDGNHHSIVVDQGMSPSSSPLGAASAASSTRSRGVRWKVPFTTSPSPRSNLSRTQQVSSRGR